MCASCKKCLAGINVSHQFTSLKKKKKQPKELHHTFASLWLLVNKLCNNMLNLNSYKPKNSWKSIVWIPHCTSKSFSLVQSRDTDIQRLPPLSANLLPPPQQKQYLSWMPASGHTSAADHWSSLTPRGKTQPVATQATRAHSEEFLSPSQNNQFYSNAEGTGQTTQAWSFTINKNVK